MREILFRGKRIDNGKWVEGYYAFIDDARYIYTGALYNVLHVVEERFEVNPSTICEYTGLTDKNGKKIFEGDILSFSQKGQIANGVVKMVDGCFFAIIEGQKCWLSEGIKRYKGKVIGSVFDNPELLQNNQEFDD